jgi:hypothetical protein
MRQSSKIILGICGILLFLLVGSYWPILQASRSDFTEQDARQMLTQMAAAFEDESVSRVLAYVYPDAKVAGRDLQRIRVLMHQAFHYMERPKVELRNMTYQRQGDTVRLRFYVTVLELATNQTLYSQSMGFLVKRRAIPQMLGLFYTYEWKIADVDAPYLPVEMGGL